MGVDFFLNENLVFLYNKIPVEKGRDRFKIFKYFK